MSQPQDRGGSTGAPPARAALPVTTAFEFPEWKTDHHVGSCFGLIVRSMGALKGLGAAFKTIKGGEVTQYTELLEDSRRHAMDRMIENARIMGANAVVGMRFDSSEIGESLTEIVAYGTAVVVSQRT
ncbi:MAG TPA: YbjQ family protein [Actinomycetota bacterium]|jgi:uncharacterized protein YbjQ (UPF0145 family)|nr:YbjQ family protein [Actinomycetota bacterium]